MIEELDRFQATSIVSMEYTAQTNLHFSIIITNFADIDHRKISHFTVYCRLCKPLALGRTVSLW